MADTVEVKALRGKGLIDLSEFSLSGLSMGVGDAALDHALERMRDDRDATAIAAFDAAL
ncbi:hypothetical protein Acor_33060 [Acrocarpospora corrugata]|uniref:FXSXX-COOH protein n=1 Tax=Acrocarpospora corrugata TaxID=35763 RepID=A0A5M3VZQ3_9ACTN|nr:hypothetical protein [Acrocarpospora corrugata]GES01242.1 hypothetical protein Acor_33060 [Acrocarpospora corrugata]